MTTNLHHRRYRRLRQLTSLLASVAIILTAALPARPAHALSRIKDIAEFEGVRENQLVGYGLVVGLDGTGDDVKKKAPFTRESLIGMLERLGVKVNQANADLEPKNVAAVMVTATLPAFARQGSEIDITVSSLGDATSLQGGTLLATPMLGADGEIYAVGQGQLTIGGFKVTGAAETVVRGVPTSGRITRGAIVEREVPFDFSQLQSLKIALRNPDFTTSRRIADAINEFVGAGTASAMDSGTVQLNVAQYGGNPTSLITDIEQLPIEPDQQARVIIDENTGVVVIGQNVRISKVAIAQGNLTIRVTETPQVSQPSPFSNTGVTTVVPRTNIDVQEDPNRKLAILNDGVTLEELVAGLNSLGVGPRDLISILQSIKTAGAMQADITVQ
ncbi:flagellar basal body P-ring protein FlgI [Dongia rigui]|uniref:Flagellar P-ring protein n=1 Tax=Dongia rigui TaxID=940149 RepID=A0ABU5DTK8_9PROT|nr:flagellar basal body P-ring protein FlgI [Dongia rigui]MDY0870538.1 flagellar basal body P-ring protein FlgI [Dongia rigui]